MPEHQRRFRKANLEIITKHQCPILIHALYEGNNEKAIWDYLTFCSYAEQAEVALKLTIILQIIEKCVKYVFANL